MYFLSYAHESPPQLGDPYHKTDIELYEKTQDVERYDDEPKKLAIFLITQSLSDMKTIPLMTLIVAQKQGGAVRATMTTKATTLMRARMTN